MSYLVLARKYRPQNFDDLVGQSHVVQTLGNALSSGRIAHAYVLSGPRGCGKTTTARILAKALNCVQGPTLMPCGICPQCVDIAGGNSTDDVLEIDGASNRGIDQIRELRETVKYAPARSRYRVIIIDEAHQISKDGFNALLKTLEEPPPHVVFMMATTESQKIPETILSRCQRFQLRSIALRDIFERLKKITDVEKLSVQEGALWEVARSAHGSLRDALSFLDQVISFAPGGAAEADVRRLLGLLPGEFVRQLAETIESGQGTRVLRAVQSAVDDGLDLSQLAEDLLERRHRLLLWKAGVTDPRAPDAAELEQEAQRLSEQRVERDVSVLSRTVAEMRRSESPRVTFELACLELAQEAVSVSELVERLEELERSLNRRLPRERQPEREPVPPAPAPPTSLSPAPPPSTPGDLLPASPSVAGAAWGAEVVRSAWSAMVNDVGHKKPSLETFLHTVRWSALPGAVLKLSFDQEFQKNQVAGQEAFWMELLRRRISTPFTVDYAVEAPRSPVWAPPPQAARPTEAPPEETEVEGAVEEEENAGEPVVENQEESSEATAVADPGVRKVLKKFPGRLRRADTGR